MKVVFIGGSGRSGSTLLGRLLSSQEGCFNAGELCFIWSRGLVEGRPCSCGRALDDCEVWGEVLEEAFGGRGAVDASRLSQEYDQFLRPRNAWRLLSTPQSQLRSLDLAAATRKLYSAIQQRTASEVIVDSSKFPTYGFFLSIVLDADLSVVHLVRNPRAVAYSWMKRKAEPNGSPREYMQQYGPFASMLRWNLYNVGTELLATRPNASYHLIRYEDFVTNPETVLGQLSEKLGIAKRARLPDLGTGTVELTAGHTVAGNPDRMRTGSVELRLDEEWSRRLSATHRHLVDLWSFLLRKRYGYG